MKGAIHDNTTSYVLGHDDGWDDLEDAHDENEAWLGRKKKMNLVEILQRTHKSRYFDSFFLAIIVIDCIVIGFTITDSVRSNAELAEVLQIIEYIFLIVFTLEMSIALLSKGPRLFRSRWFVFNLLVITASWAYPTLQIIRGFCILRLLTKMGEMQKIIYALESVLPIFESIAVLLGVIFYVAAVIFTDLFSDMYEEGLVSEDYFGDMAKTLFTLFQVTTGAGWTDIAREIMVTYSGAWVPFVVFVCVTMFILVELTVAALCRSVQKMEEIDSSTQVDEAKNEDIARIEHRLNMLHSNLLAGNNNERVESLSASRPREVRLVKEPLPLVKRRVTSSSAGITITKSSGEEWYEKLAFSFEKETEDNYERIQASYNCFPARIQTLCGTIVNNERFGIAVILLIILNNVLLGIATWDFVKDNQGTKMAFDILDFIFLVFFTAELSAQFAYRGMSFFKVGWLNFDLLVITASWMMLIAQLGFLGISLFKSGWLSFDLVLASWVMPVLKAARAFRCFRLFSRVQFMRKIAEAVFLVLSKLGITAGLLLVMFYIFGVIFTDLFKDMYANGLTNDDYFSDLGKTFFTLFQCMTIAGWPDISREVMATYSWAWLPFITWIILSKFTMIQLIIAILCQNLTYTEGDSAEQATDGVEQQNYGTGELARLEAKMDLLSEHVEYLLASRDQKSTHQASKGGQNV